MKDIEDEIPFEVPEGWAWCKISEVCKPFGRIGFRGYTKADIVDKGYGAISLSPSNMKEMKVTFENCTYISWEKYEESPEIMINENDIIIVKTGSSYGKTCIIRNLPEKVTLNPQLMVLKNVIINSSYLCYYLNTKYFRKCYENLVNGTAIPTFSQEKFANNFIPLPPIKEQKQIGAKIEEIFTQIDSLDASKADLQTAIKHAKSKILDLAIHGKLVPQDPSEEPASKLLERIRAEKEAKIAAGELKRDKNDSYIYKNPSDNCHYRKYDNHQEECIESEIAFSLPESWQWVNLGGIFAHNTGKALNKSKLEGEYKDYITTSNVYWDRFEFNNVSKMPFTPEEMKKCTVTKGDLLICEGGDVGRSNIWDKDYDICIQNHLHRLRAFVPVETKLFYYWLMLFKQRNMIIGKGIGLMGFSSSLVHNLLIPLPPLAEQKRIVSKIEEIFSNLDEIVENLS